MRTVLLLVVVSLMKSLVATFVSKRARLSRVAPTVGEFATAVRRGRRRFGRGTRRAANFGRKRRRRNDGMKE
jgi:hypothetical protein